MQEGFHYELKRIINEYVLFGYDLFDLFPKEELYGMTSQVRRALVSVMLNYVEGYARRRPKEKVRFYEYSYASLQESVYVFYLACRRDVIAQSYYLDIFERKEHIAKMLWNTICGIEHDIRKES